MVETFLSVHQEDFEKERIPMQAISWRDLRLHSQYVARYIKGLLTGLRGEEEEGMKQVEDLVLWLWQIEKEVQPRWDIFLHIGHLPVWYQRLMDQKHQEEKKEKIDLLSKNSAQEQEGFQA